MRNLLLGALLGLCITLPVTAHAKALTVTRKAGVYMVKGDKAVLIGSLDAQTPIIAHRTIGHGKWVEFDYKKTRALIKTDATDLNINRSVASTRSSSNGSANHSGMEIKAGATLNYGTTLGFGLGINGEVIPQAWKSAKGEFSGELGFTYYPSVVGSSLISVSGMTFAAMAKYAFRLTPTILAGPEAGLALVQASVATSTIPGVTVVANASATSIALAVGGFAEGTITKEISWCGGLRLYTTGGLAFIAGAKYAF